MTTLLTNGNRVAKINNQQGTYYTLIIVNGDQVVASKYHNTLNGAKRYGTKNING